jgi:hypothetical protein
LIRRLTATAILASSVLFLALTISKDSSGNRDFVAYWAAAKLLATQGNPYDIQGTLRVEQSAGWHSSQPMMMLTTPFFLPLIAPLSLVGERTGAILWTLVIVSCLILSIRTLWVIYGRPPNRLHLLCYLFAPLIFCVFAGQAVAFVLTGLVLFLRWQPSRPFLGGLCLGLAVTIKPHLFIAFGVALIYRTVATRRYQALSGVIAGMLALGLTATLLDPHCWSQYLATMREANVGDKILPNSSLLFRIAINQNLVWLQLFPAAMASIWALWYVRRHHADWDWTVHGSLLMMVSEWVAPYSWFFDEITLLPALLRGVYMAGTYKRSLVSLAICNFAALAMVFCSVPVNVFYYTWTPLAWLATYSYAVRPRTGLVTATPAGLIPDHKSVPL